MHWFASKVTGGTPPPATIPEEDLFPGTIIPGHTPLPKKTSSTDLFTQTGPETGLRPMDRKGMLSFHRDVDQDQRDAIAYENGRDFSSCIYT